MRLPMKSEAGLLRASLHDEVLIRLRRMITEGELPAGAKVPEAELCEQFGISRTPLREALKVLAAEGFVSLRLNRGATVTEMTLRDLEDGFPVMASIEALSAELACDLLDAKERDGIAAATKRMRAEHLAGRIEPYFAANREIHYTLVRASRNDVLIGIYDNLFVRMRRARLVTSLSLERRLQSVEEHEMMVEHIMARDPAAMAGVMREHILGLLTYYRQVLTDPRPDATGTPL